MAPKPAPCSCARCAGGSEVGFEDEVDAGVCQGKRKIKNWIYLPKKGQRENEDNLKSFQELMADWDCAEFSVTTPGAPARTAETVKMAAIQASSRMILLMLLTRVVSL